MPPSTPPARGEPNLLRQATRLAQYVRAMVLAMHHDRLSALSSRLTTFVSFADDLRDTQRRLDVCRSRGWATAARSLQDRLENLLQDLSCESSSLRTQLADQHARLVPTMGDILAELHQIEDEFGAYHHNPAEQTLWVETEPITLEEVRLGPFQIELRLRELSAVGRRQPYEVIALEPNPAGSNDSVTHPHVSDKHLCEGDATVSIRKALEQGRLCEFFLLVRSVLTTYNPSSPYVALDKWDGVSCYDCGSTVGAEDTNTCNSCDDTFCNDCSSYCRCCESTYCHGCLTECPSCGENTCKDCMKLCDECGDKCCTNCLVDSFCPDCLQQKKENSCDAQAQPQPAPAPGSPAPESRESAQGPESGNATPASGADRTATARTPTPPGTVPVAGAADLQPAGVAQAPVLPARRRHRSRRVRRQRPRPRSQPRPRNPRTTRSSGRRRQPAVRG